MSPITLDKLTPIGSGLHRPECVLAHQSGSLFVSNWKGGVSCVSPTGESHELLASEGSWLRPNGIALDADGSFLLCHLGDDRGGVFRLSPSGQLTPVATEVDGTALPPTNYAHRDAHGRLWITVSTRRQPRAKAYRHDVSDGFILLIDDRGIRIVADDLGYTNECLVDPDGSRLFVNETFARRLSYYDIQADGSLSNKQTLAEFGEGTFPDGMAFDAEGGIWITSIVSNRVVRVSADGEQQTLLEDADPEHLASVEEAFQRGEMGRPHLDRVRSKKLRSISSLAFGGPDLRTVYLGCLLGDALFTFRSPIAGLPPPHWRFSLTVAQA